MLLLSKLCDQLRFFRLGLFCVADADNPTTTRQTTTLLRNAISVFR
jgi:hypothetical protein